MDAQGGLSKRIKRLLRRGRTEPYRYHAPDVMHVDDQDKTLARLQARKEKLTTALHSMPPGVKTVRVDGDALTTDEILRRLNDVEVMLRAITGQNS